MLSPTDGTPVPASAHLYLAQLSDEDPHLALKHYEAAAGILHGQLKGKERAGAPLDPSEESEADIRKNIVKVLVAMVEIWMAPTYDLWCVLFWGSRNLFTYSLPVSTPRQKKHARGF